MSQLEQFSDSNDPGAKAGLNLGSIRSTRVAMPEKKEMDIFVKTLDQLDETIKKKEQVNKASRNLKNSLMQDLLTGKVRVTPETA